MNIKSIHILLFIGVLAMLVSCASSRKAQKDKGTTILVPSPSSAVQGVRGKTSVTVTMGGNDLSLGGTVKMSKGALVQVSMTAMGLMEVARLEVKPSGILLMDRYHQRYVEMSWDEIRAMDRQGHLAVLGDDPFATVQDLCWGTVSDEVVSQLSALGVKWTYPSWVKVEDTAVPECTDIELRMGSTLCRCSFQNTNMTTLTTTLEPTVVDTSRYTSMSLREITGMLKNY